MLQKRFNRRDEIFISEHGQCAAGVPDNVRIRMLEQRDYVWNSSWRFKATQRFESVGEHCRVRALQQLTNVIDIVLVHVSMKHSQDSGGLSLDFQPGIAQQISHDWK